MTPLRYSLERAGQVIVAAVLVALVLWLLERATG